MENGMIYYNRLNSPEWPLVIAATDKGFCYMGSLGGSEEELFKWGQATFSSVQFEQSASHLEQYEKQLMDYFSGRRHSFNFPLDLHGTPFQQTVWQALRNIPYGETRTYSEIAHEIEKPTAIRAAASAIGKNPAMVAVPCHRVIQKNGSLSGFRGSIEMKQRLLELENERSSP